MNILALNIGKRGSWALYNSTSCNSITWGRFVYKKDSLEKKEAPIKRFLNILDDKNYHTNGIDKIYYSFCDDDKKPRIEFLKALQEFCEKNNINYDKVEYKESDVLDIRKKYLTIEDNIEAGAVAILELGKKHI